jgi:DNA polymerase III delta prime subunit
MSLAAVVKGKISQPLRLILYGPPGIGKSTFASNAPAPIFIGAEKGTAQLDVNRFPQPEKWDDVFDAMIVLGTQKHDYKTLVLDTVDWLEPLCHRFICEKESEGKSENQKITSIDAFGYGRGYNLALDQWRKLLTFLERLCDKQGMNIILLAHSQIRNFKNPEGEDFDRYEMKLHHKAGGLLQEWADEVLFANYETFTTETKGRVRGLSSGMRLIHTVRTAAFDAKNRHDLPDQLPLAWPDYEAATRDSKPADVAELKRAIGELIETVDAETKAKAEETVKAAGNDAARLAQILNRLRALSKKEAA